MLDHISFSSLNLQRQYQTTEFARQQALKQERTLEKEEIQIQHRISLLNTNTDILV